MHPCRSERPPIVLSEKEQEGLLQITKRHRSEQQVVMRARIVLYQLPFYVVK